MEREIQVAVALNVPGLNAHLLPLGPVVQHTAGLGEDTLIEEVWVFGATRQGIELSGPPPGVRVRHW